MRLGVLCREIHCQPVSAQVLCFVAGFCRLPLQIQENSGKFDAGLTAVKPRRNGGKTREKRRKNPESHFGWLLACYFARVLGTFCCARAFSSLLLTAVNMQHLPSKSLSSSTLCRGADLLRSQTMSLENDPTFQLLLAERDKLLAPQ